MAGTANQTDVNLSEIKNENLFHLIKRWKCSQENVESTMERFRMSRQTVESLAKLTLEDLEMAASVGYSLFNCVCDDRFFDLVPKVSSPKELGRLMVLHHG